MSRESGQFLFMHLRSLAAVTLIDHDSYSRGQRDKNVTVVWAGLSFAKCSCVVEYLVLDVMVKLFANTYQCICVRTLLRFGVSAFVVIDQGYNENVHQFRESCQL
eukprot:14909726-Ditylum_brightwellii.AAC.1